MDRGGFTVRSLAAAGSVTRECKRFDESGHRVRAARFRASVSRAASGWIVRRAEV
jgi:hypothetical protein